MDSHKILVPVSWTENSANGLKYAIDLAKSTNNELDILHVLNNPAQKNYGIPHADFFQKELNADLKYKKIISTGNTTEEIERTASDLEPDLIVMSPDIFNKGKKYFEESETGKLILKSNYPILIISPTIEFKSINNIILGTDMRDNILESIHGLLKIFRNQSPSIHILVFTDKTPEWHFKEDVNTLLQKIKNYTEYLSITGNICENKDSCLGLELFAAKANADLICMESNATIFYSLFFHCKNVSEMSYLLHKPILILPRYWGDSFKKS